MNDQPLVYLDSAATSLKPKSVVEAIDNYNLRFSTNVHRGVYKLGNQATELYENARKHVA
jgi:cysteine desulfurase/selenocysteine lyase